MFRAFTALLWRDLLLAYRRRAELANPLLFYLLVISLFPLGLDPERELLRSLAPGVVWIAALLAALLSLEGIFRSDFEDGALELLLVSSHPPALLVLAKVCAHWLVAGLPLTILAPFMAAWLCLPTNALPVLVLTLALGTPVLSLVGAIGVALTVGLRRGGMLLTLLVLPLYIPVLIFGAHAVDAAANGLAVDGQLAILGALLILALTLAPVTIAAALRISIS